MDKWLLLIFIIYLVIRLIVIVLRMKRSKKFNKTPIGTLRVDRSDPSDCPYLFLELYQGSDPSIFKDGDIITFQVSTKNYLSQD